MEKLVKLVVAHCISSWCSPKSHLIPLAQVRAYLTYGNISCMNPLFMKREGVSHTNEPTRLL